MWLMRGGTAVWTRRSNRQKAGFEDGATPGVARFCARILDRYAGLGYRSPVHFACARTATATRVTANRPRGVET